MSAKCSACGAAIIWTTTEAGKQAPIDAEPCADGTIAISIDGRLSEVVKDPKLAREAGMKLHKNHFSTCPDAAKFRKKQNSNPSRK